MPKCKTCNSCMHIIRSDYGGKSLKVWYCYFCNLAYDLYSRKLIEDKGFVTSAKDNYERKFGKVI